MNATLSRIHQLIAYHENAAATLRQTIRLIAGADRTRRAPRPAPHVAQALTIDAARRRTRKKPSKTGPQSNAAKAARRARSAELLAKFDPTTPKKLADLGLTNGHRVRIGPFINAGYLRAKGPGYVRTPKPFAVTLDR